MRRDLETWFSDAAREDAGYWRQRARGRRRHARPCEGDAGRPLAVAARCATSVLALGTWQGIYLCEHARVRWPPADRRDAQWRVNAASRSLDRPGVATRRGSDRGVEEVSRCHRVESRRAPSAPASTSTIKKSAEARGALRGPRRGGRCADRQQGARPVGRVAPGLAHARRRTSRRAGAAASARASGPRGRTREQLYNDAKKLEHLRPLEDDQEAAARRGQPQGRLAESAPQAVARLALGAAARPPPGAAARARPGA